MGAGADAVASARALGDCESDVGPLVIWAISSAEAVETGASEPPPHALSAAKVAKAASRCVTSNTCFAVWEVAGVGFMSISQKNRGWIGEAVLI